MSRARCPSFPRRKNRCWIRLTRRRSLQDARTQHLPPRWKPRYDGALERRRGRLTRGPHRQQPNAGQGGLSRELAAASDRGLALVLILATARAFVPLPARGRSSLGRRPRSKDRNQAPGCVRTALRRNRAGEICPAADPTRKASLLDLAHGKQKKRRAKKLRDPHRAANPVNSVLRQARSLHISARRRRERANRFVQLLPEAPTVRVAPPEPRVRREVSGQQALEAPRDPATAEVAARAAARHRGLSIPAAHQSAGRRALRARIVPVRVRHRVPAMAALPLVPKAAGHSSGLVAKTALLQAELRAKALRRAIANSRQGRDREGFRPRDRALAAPVRIPLAAAAPADHPPAGHPLEDRRRVARLTERRLRPADHHRAGQLREGHRRVGRLQEGRPAKALATSLPARNQAARAIRPVGPLRVQGHLRAEDSLRAQDRAQEGPAPAAAVPRPASDRSPEGGLQQSSRSGASRANERSND
jgi:hypothetical protein